MDIVERLTARADELPAEIAEDENEKSSHCGPYGSDTADDYMDDPDRLLLLEAAAEIARLRSQVERKERALQTLVTRCETDEEQGYRSALRTYVLEIARPALETPEDSNDR